MSNTQIQPRRPRVPFVRPVHVSRNDGSDSRWLLASNISEGGLFVRTPQPPAVGTRLRLDLEARGQTLRFAEAEVIWSRPVDVTRLSQALPGFGVRFMPLSDDSQALVRHLVDVGGTGRGQAKTVPFSSPDALTRAAREPLHAPASAMMEALVPTERAVTGEWTTVPPMAENREPKVIVNLTDPPIAFADEGPMLDRNAVAALPAADSAAPRRSSRSTRGGDWAAGLILVAAAAVGGLCAWRGLGESASASISDGPVTVITAPAPTPAPAPVAEVASPEGPGEITAANVEGKPAPPVKAPAATATPKPANPPPAPVAAAIVAPSAVALPSGAAKSVVWVEQGNGFQITPALVAGASIDRVFTLSAPPRLVIDLNGPTPKGAPHLAGHGPVTSVRLGARAGGTRMVLDLARAPAKVSRSGDGVAVELR